MEGEESFNTIFDDVFRTIAQKMPFLLIPLINEVFATKYTEDQEFEQLRNEHYEKFGKIITDSIIRIGGRLYHIECQSKKDGDMALRMVEYDFAIALEHSSKMESDIIEINFPESCVLYIRNHRDMPDHHKARVRFANGQTVAYQRKDRCGYGRKDITVSLGTANRKGKNGRKVAGYYRRQGQGIVFYGARWRYHFGMCRKTA